MRGNQLNRHGSMLRGKGGMLTLLGLLAIVVICGVVAFSMSNNTRTAFNDRPAASGKSTTGAATSDPTGAARVPKAGDPTGANAPKQR
jgi:hypothetical protein